MKMIKQCPKGWVFININSLFFLSKIPSVPFSCCWANDTNPKRRCIGFVSLLWTWFFSLFDELLCWQDFCISTRFRPTQKQSFNRRDDISFFNSSNSTPLFSAVLTSQVHLLVDNALGVETPIEEKNWRDKDQVHTGHPQTDVLVLEISCCSGWLERESLWYDASLWPVIFWIFNEK